MSKAECAHCAKTDPLEILEDAIGSLRKPADTPSHEILNMHKVFAVIDECYRLRAELSGDK